MKKGTEPLRKKLKDMLMAELESRENYLREKAHAKSPEFKQVVDATQEQLGLMVNETGLTLDLVKARIRGEDIDVPEWHVQALYDVTFDFEDYKALGDNDGTLRMIARTLEMIGYDKLSPRAWAAMYTNNY